MTAPLLEVENLRVTFTGDRPVEAVRGVSFSVGRGETFGIVGESGSGKSVTALATMRLLPPGSRVEGAIRFEGEDLLTLDERRMRRLRGRQISMIFQDPLASLNPAFTIGRQLVDAIRAHEEVSMKVARRRAAESLGTVGIPTPASRLDSYPHEFSGGMRQRVLIAMMIACQPRLLIADEPTTALDVTIQAQVVGLLRRLQRELDLSIVFISHNLDLVAELCDRVMVMYDGLVMEEAPVDRIFLAPRHPYTRLLRSCVPRLDSAWENHASPRAASREVAAERDRKLPGCPFRNRCAETVDACATMPGLSSRERHRVACWMAA